jgi:SAM-dependent methyltransferase
MSGQTHSSPPAVLANVKAFWEANPLCASAIPHPLGSREYFQFYDRLREENESVEFSAALHEYDAFGGKQVLDVGSGNGYVLSRYAQAGATVTGVDLTSTGIGLCRKRFDLFGLPGRFVIGDAEALPFASEAFDCVCSMGVLHHTPETARAVGEVWRVMKPGGRLIVMFYHRNSVLNRLTFPLARLRTGKSREQLVNEVDGYGNPKGDVYSKAELQALLREFTDLECQVGLLQRWMLPARLSRFVSDARLAEWGRRWGWFIYAKGRKAGHGSR